MRVGFRILFFVICTLSTYFLPWWVLFAVAILVMILKRVVLFELIVPALLIDTLYSIPIDRFFNFQFVATSIMLIIILIAWFVKKQFRY